MMIKMELYLGKNVGGMPNPVSFPQLQSLLDVKVQQPLQAFTITEGFGYWKEKYEPCFILTSVFDERSGVQSVLLDIANAYRFVFCQESVMITSQEVNVQFVNS